MLWSENYASRHPDKIKLMKKCSCKHASFKQQKRNKKVDKNISDGKSSGRGYVRLEIADKDIRDQVNKEYLGSKSFFLDRATKNNQSFVMTDAQSSMDGSQGARSRSVHTPPAGVSPDFEAGFDSNMSSIGFSDGSRSREPSPIDLRNCCQNEIELRDRVLSSKRMLLRNFFSQYIKQLMLVNEQLNKSYLMKLRQDYMQLRE